MDALYRRLGSTATYALFQPPITSLINRIRGNSWEFPLLGKYYFRQRESGWQPYIGTGWSFRTVGFHSDGAETSTDVNGVTHTFSFQDSYRSDLAIGAVFSAGVRLHSGRLAFLPEVRYTRWGTADNVTRKNEAKFLLGISF